MFVNAGLDQVEHFSMKWPIAGRNVRISRTDRLRPDLSLAQPGSCLHYLAVNRPSAAGLPTWRQARRMAPEPQEEPDMKNVTALIDRYIAMWNETDAKARRDLDNRSTASA